MKRFRSKWRSVLGLAEFEHQRALLEVARLTRALHALREQRAAFESVLTSEERAQDRAGLAPLRQAYRASLARALRQKDLEIQRTGAELGESRQRLEAKRRRRDSMRSLQDKERARHVAEQRAAEQDELDELARMRRGSTES